MGQDGSRQSTVAHLAVLGGRQLCDFVWEVMCSSSWDWLPCEQTFNFLQELRFSSANRACLFYRTPPLLPYLDAHYL